MLSTSARLLRLLTLLQTRRHWSGAALGERLGVDARTVRRDVDRLRELGYPVHASSGLGGGYQLGAGTEMPPVILEDDEAVTMAVALRAAATSLGGVAESAIALVAKLDRLLPTGLKERVRALESVMVALPGGDRKPDVDALATVAAACRDRQRLAIAYRDRDGAETRRTVEPLHLVHTDRRWYLVAWDQDREDFRTFRMDRLAAPVPAGGVFVPRPLPEALTTFASRALAVSPFRYRVRARLPGSAEALARTVPSWCGMLEPVDAESCVLHVGADSADAVVSLLLMTGVSFEILDDPPFLDALRAVAGRVYGSLAPDRAAPL